MFIPKKTLRHPVALTADELLQYGLPVRQLGDFCEEFGPQAGETQELAEEIRDLLHQEGMEDEG